MSGRPGRSGPRAKPAALHLVDGTHRKSRHGDARAIRDRVQRNRAARLPCPPNWLSSYAKTEWKRMAQLLRDQGMLEQVDRAALATYCRAWSQLRDAEKLIQEQGLTVTGGSGGEKLNPAVTAASQAQKQIKDFCVEYGMTPAARSRVQPGKQESGGIDVGPSGRKAGGES